MMHCHDMAGGYNPRYVIDHDLDCSFRRVMSWLLLLPPLRRSDIDYLEAFSGWDTIDEFVYFAHHRVSIPPAAWIESCHAHGVPCYGTSHTKIFAVNCLTALLSIRFELQTDRLRGNTGTLITEHKSGAAENSALLSPVTSAKCISQLARIIAHYGFDGWFVNIEAPLAGGASQRISTQWPCFVIPMHQFCLLRRARRVWASL
eukprot:SAG31_NODE_1240_length_9167_cov_4.729599_11_plen_203_part_00